MQRKAFKKLIVHWETLLRKRSIKKTPYSMKLPKKFVLKTKAKSNFLIHRRPSLNH